MHLYLLIHNNAAVIPLHQHINNFFSKVFLTMILMLARSSTYKYLFLTLKKNHKRDKTKME